MSKISSLPPRLSIAGGREAKSSAGINQIKSVMVSGYPVAEIGQYSRFGRDQQPHPVGEQNELERRIVSPEDRRKASLRAIQQKMLVEFRSGRNRRHQYQRGNDIVEQIDEEA
jgi:hypothetical protein